MSKKGIAKWIIALIVAVIGVVGPVLLWWLKTPSAIVGYVADPPGLVRVVLDNGAQRKDADDISGFFRFELVKLGAHNLRFQHRGYNPVSVEIIVRSRGDNYLEQKVRLERALAGVGEPNTGPVQIGTIAIPTRSSDGSGPRVPAAVVQNLTNVIGSPEPDQSGWVYLGTFDGREWQKQAIEVGETLPVKGAVLIAGSGALLWTKEPESRFLSGYEAGRLSAVVQRGDTLIVRDLRTDIGRNNVWALVDVGVPHSRPRQ